MARLPRLLRFVLLASPLLSLILILNLLPILRGHEILKWQWDYIPPTDRAIPLLVLIIVYVIGAWRLFNYTRLLMLWSIIAVVLLSLASVYTRYDDVFYGLWIRTVSIGTTGPHYAGAAIDWSSQRTITQWGEVMQDFNLTSSHLALSPPGLAVFYAGINSILEGVPSLTKPIFQFLLPYQCHNFLMLDFTPAQWASSLVGVFMPLWAGLAVIPLYACARRFAKSEAKWVIVWWALVPALLSFAPTWNTVYPLFTLIAFWIFLRGNESTGIKAVLAWFISGVCVSLLTFANLSLVPLPLIFGFYALIHYYRNERVTQPIYRPLWIGLWFSLGLVSIWVIYYFVSSGTSPLDILHVAFNRHLELDRPYLPWVFFHGYEWVLFTGIPLGLLWLWASWRQLRSLKQSGNVVAIALSLTMLILLLSGTGRGETGRVWIFFSPFTVIGAVELLHSLKLPNSETGWMVTIAQASLTFAVALTIRAIDINDFTNPPLPPDVVSEVRPLDVHMGNLHLVGWNGEITDDTLHLTLNWQAQEQILRPYWFAALAVDPQGNPAGDALVWQALGTKYPTTCWIPNTIISDQVDLPLPEDAEAGDWWVSLAVIPEVDQPENRLPVTLPDGSTDVQVGLGPTTKAE